MRAWIFRFLLVLFLIPLIAAGFILLAIEIAPHLVSGLRELARDWWAMFKRGYP